MLHSLNNAALTPERELDSLTARAVPANLVNVRVVMRRYPPYKGKMIPAGH